MSITPSDRLAAGRGPARPDPGIDVRALRDSGAEEIYVYAPPFPAEPAQQARQAYASVAEALTAREACIAQERLFVTDPDCIEGVLAARASALGTLDDGVPPTVLLSDAPIDGLAGVQLHGVAGVEAETLLCHGRPIGRRFAADGVDFLVAQGLTGPADASPPEQAEAMLRAGRELLDRAGLAFTDVVRTWMWLGKILDWYDAFNAVRTTFFRDCGVLRPGRPARPPASTGIGIGPGGAGVCTMDLVAVGPAGQRELFSAAGNQQSACEYGSSFSRAASAVTPAGRTLYVSGTAAIDAAGRTTHVGDGPAQIADTIANVRAVLDETGYADGDVVEAVIYCKTPTVARAWDEMADRPDWPGPVLIADVCREDLLFEIEAVAATKRDP